jgi:hypothetical protein
MTHPYKTLASSQINLRLTASTVLTPSVRNGTPRAAMTAKPSRAWFALLPLLFASPAWVAAQDRPDTQKSPVGDATVVSDGIGLSVEMKEMDALLEGSPDIRTNLPDNVSDKDGAGFGILFNPEAVQGDFQKNVLSEEALTILRTTRRSINFQLSKRGVIGIEKEGKTQIGVTDTSKVSGSKVVPYDTTNLGSFVVWPYVDSTKMLGAQAVWETKQAYNKNLHYLALIPPTALALGWRRYEHGRNIRDLRDEATGKAASRDYERPGRAFGRTLWIGATIVSIPISYWLGKELFPEEILPNLNYDMAPWNRKAGLWNAFVKYLMFKAREHVVGMGNPPAPTDQPNVIPVAVHPAVLKEVYELWADKGWLKNPPELLTPEN